MVKRLMFSAVCGLSLLCSLVAYAENTRFTNSHFSGSGNCATCHDGLTDTSGENVSIVRDWGTSMMANATKDPFWQAKVATELERNPHLSSVINDKCTQCHAPMANYVITEVQGEDIELFGATGVLNQDHVQHDAAMNGVSCTLCHQIKDDANLGTLNGSSGHYTIDQNKNIYGQYSDIMGRPMTNSTGYTPTYSAHISDSAICATCHDLKTPYVDAAGNILTTSPESEFPEQMPYTEWLQSIFADSGSNPKSCQDCHMPKTSSKVSNRPRWLNSKAGFAKHHLVGANTVMLTLLKNNASQLDVISPDLDLGISRAREMLQSSAGIEIVSARVSNGVLETRVRVENNSGHKAPTSYPSRRMWLHFKITDSNNSVVFESGGINADGSIKGADNDLDQTIFEPHYSLITSADQVQIYETTMSDSDGNITYTLLRGAHYLKDNRLTPKGFDKFGVPSDVAVLGEAANDDDFNLGSDELTYRIPVSVSGELNVTVTLNYQTIAHGFLQDLYRDDHLQQVQTFRTLYDAQSLKHEQVASAQTSVVSEGVGTLPVPVVDLLIAPSMIDKSESATISWTSSDASSCNASGAWSGAINTSGYEIISPSVTTTYTITCSGESGIASDTVTLDVNEIPVQVVDPVVNLSVSSSVIQQGQSTILSWSSSGTNGCTTSGAWEGARDTSGSETVAPNSSSTFIISCAGDAGSVSDSVTVTVSEPTVAIQPTVSFNASPSRVRRGETIILNWSAVDASSCTASGGWSGVKANSGTESIVINGPATYSLTCSNEYGSINGSVSYRTRGRGWLTSR